MDSYCELKALPNPEIIQSIVMAELMNALHPLLVKFEGRIGVDFPEYRQQHTLGGMVRLFGNKTDIEAIHDLLAMNTTIEDYSLLTKVMEIPQTVHSYVTCQRRHARGSSRFRRLKKRHQERGTWTEELEQAVSEKLSISLNLPYMAISSASTSQTFLLFIERKRRKAPLEGLFNGYGLGLSGATVPVF